MGLQDWNWRLPVELQDVPWDCAAASLTWCLNTVGRGVTEADVLAVLYPTYLNEEYGLLDASGAGLVEALQHWGVLASNNPDASWFDVWSAAGDQPMLMGGRAWNHWTGVRIANNWLFQSESEQVALANPAPGWMGVGQLIDSSQFAELGPFSAVWFTSW